MRCKQVEAVSPFRSADASLASDVPLLAVTEVALFCSLAPKIPGRESHRSRLGHEQEPVAQRAWEIKTDARRIIEYLRSPLMQCKHESLRERCA